MELGILTAALAEVQRLSGSLTGGLTDDAYLALRYMIIISYSLAVILWLIDGRPVIASSYVMMLVRFCTFSWLISLFPTFVPNLFNAALNTGPGIVGTGAVSLNDPGAVAVMGFEVARPIFEHMKTLIGPIDIFTNFFEIACFFVSWLLIVLAFCFLGLMLFIFQAEFFLLAPIAMLTVAFGVFGPSSYLAERGIGYTVASCVRVLVLGCIAAGTAWLIATMKLPAVPTVKQALSTMVLCALMAWMTWRLPNIFAGLLAGGPVLGFATALSDMFRGMAGVKRAGGAAASTAGGAAKLVGGALTASAGVAGFAAAAIGGAAAGVRAAGQAAGAAGSAAGTTGNSNGQTNGGQAGSGGQGISGNGGFMGAVQAAASGAVSGVRNHAASRQSSGGNSGGSSGGGRWGQGPTAKQQAAAASRGININGMNRGQASQALQNAGMDPSWWPGARNN